MTVEEIKSIGKDAIIKLAFEKLEKGDIDIGVFDRIKIIESEDEVWVNFDMAFKYVPLESAYFYSAGVGLVEGYTVISPLSNPLGNENIRASAFFKPTKESKNAILFILDAINKDEETGVIPKGILPEDTDMRIFEKQDHFEIEVHSPSTVSFYKIKKNTGEVYDGEHEHVMLDLEDDLIGDGIEIDTEYEFIDNELEDDAIAYEDVSDLWEADEVE